MQIDERTVGDVLILDIKGRITLGEGDELLKDKVNSLLNQGQKKIILNLAEVPYIDSAGLGEIVRTYTTVSRQGGSLKLLSLTKRITDLLAITKLLTVCTEPRSTCSQDGEANEQNLSVVPPETLPLTALAGVSLLLQAVEPVAGLLSARLT